MPDKKAPEARQGAVETWDDGEILAAIADGQQAAIDACRAATASIAAAAELLARCWRAGGQIAYAGAGSSGLIAMLDALELPGTYGLSPERLPVLLAGGRPSLQGLDQGSEDDVVAARAAAEILGPGDVVIAVSASGSTPFTIALAEAARARGAQVIGMACTSPAPLLEGADIGIALITGPEIVAGSTRMQAGTAQKCALNMLSTLLGMKLHHVHDGLMVNVRTDNAKLRERAAGIVSRIADVDLASAYAALSAADGEAKLAVLLARGMGREAAVAGLERAGGNLRAALTGGPG